MATGHRAVPSSFHPSLSAAADPIFTAPGLANGSSTTAICPLLYGVIPRPGRDAGLGFRCRFGS